MVEVKEQEKPQPTAVIIGSFRFKDILDRVIDQFEVSGIKILAPRKGKVVARGVTGYAILDADADKKPSYIQEAFQNAIRAADFVYVVNPDGYIGIQGAAEFAMAVTLGTPAYAMEPFDETLDDTPGWKFWSTLARPKTAEEVAEIAKSGNYLKSECPWYREDRDRRPQYVSRIPYPKDSNLKWMWQIMDGED